MTAATLFQAMLAVPGRVIPNDPVIEQAVLLGEQRLQDIGCATCHMSSLLLDQAGWIFTEPNSYNPPGNLKLGEAPTLTKEISPRMHLSYSYNLYSSAAAFLKIHS